MWHHQARTSEHAATHRWVHGLCLFLVGTCAPTDFVELRSLAQWEGSIRGAPRIADIKERADP
jgi:hypothetical protein